MFYVANATMLIQNRKFSKRKGAYVEIVLLSENKLKITLSESDVAVLGFPEETQDAEKIKSSRAFKNLLETAKIKTGFDVNECRLFVSIYRSRDYGIEMYITKCGRDKQKNGNMEKNEFVAFRFDCGENLLGACAALYRAVGPRQSSAFWEYDNGYTYYLTLTGNISAYLKSVVCEYSVGREIIDDENILMHIFEHGNTICEKNALEVLAKTVPNVVY